MGDRRFAAGACTMRIGLIGAGCHEPWHIHCCAEEEVSSLPCWGRPLRQVSIVSSTRRSITDRLHPCLHAPEGLELCGSLQPPTRHSPWTGWPYRHVSGGDRGGPQSAEKPGGGVAGVAARPRSAVAERGAGSRLLERGRSWDRGGGKPQILRRNPAKCLAHSCARSR
jgi:hypothetical protein